MKTSFLKKLYAAIITSVFSFIAVNAQIIYTDVKPDKTFTCSEVGCSHIFNLDLNNDGINDFRFEVLKNTTPVSCGSHTHWSEVHIILLDSNSVVMNLDYVSKLYTNAVISDINSYSIYGDEIARYDWVPGRNDICTFRKLGEWSSLTTDGYVGLKLKKGAKTYFGWARISVSITDASTSFTIKDYAYNSVPNQPIVAGQSTNLNVVVTSPVTDSPFCAGTTVSVPYEVEGAFNASNIFTVQLSDSTGSFANPVAIGSKQSAVAGTINAKIPRGTHTGARYRIHVISSSPSSILYDNGSDIIIHHGIPDAVISANGSTEFCSGAGVVSLSTPSMYGVTYQWLDSGTPLTNETGNQTYVSSSGNYQCVISNACGNDTSNTIVVTADPLPNAVITESGSTLFCKGGSVTLYANTEAGLIYQWIVGPSGDTISRNSFYIAADTVNHYYQVRETNSKGCINYSDLIFVEVVTREPAPAIYAFGDTTFCAGDSVRLVVNNLKYTVDQFQWKKNGTNISGATSLAYYPKTAGVYKCIVSNICGSTTTSGIKLTTKQCMGVLNNTATSDAKIISTTVQLKVAPNPFSNSTNISFTLLQSQKVSIGIYDMAGRLVKVLADAQMQAGTHWLVWNAKDEKGNAVSAGIYFVRLQAGNYVESKKISVVK